MQTSEVTQDKHKEKKVGSPTKAVLRRRVRKGGAAERQGEPQESLCYRSREGFAEEEGSLWDLCWEGGSDEDRRAWESLPNPTGADCFH